MQTSDTATVENTSGLFSNFRWVPWLLAAYFAVQAVVRILMPNSLRIDEAQQFLFGQWLAFGYDTQPPLYNWLQYGVFALFGTSLASLAILKNVVLFLVYFAYHRLSRELLADRGLAAVSTLALLTMPQMFWQAQRDLTHTVATLLAICLLIYFAVITLKRPSALSFAMMGVWAGFGMLTKYNFALVIVATFVAVLRHPDGLKRLLDKRFLLTVVAAVLIFLPHGWWMVTHVDLAFSRTMDTMSEQGAGGKLSDICNGLIELFGTGAVIAAPTTAIFLIVFGKSFIQSLRAKSEWTNFFSTLLGTTLVVLLLLIVVVTLTTFRDRWLLPFLFLLPLYFCLKLEASGVNFAERVGRFLYVPLAMMAALPLVLAGGILLAGQFGSYEHLNTPYRAFVQQVTAAEGQTPATVVTTSWHKAGNMRINLPTTPVISTDFPAFGPDRDTIARGPVLLVWNERDGGQSAMPQALSDWAAKALGPQYAHPVERDMALPFYYGKDPDRYHFGYAWIYPGSQEDSASAAPALD